MVKHTKAIRWQKPMNCLIVFDHFVGLGERDIDEEEKKNFHVWTHDYILNRYPVDVLDVYWTSYVRAIYVQCLRGRELRSY